MPLMKSRAKDVRQVGLPKGGGSYIGNQISRWIAEELPKATEAQLQAVISNDPNGSKANAARKELSRRGSVNDAERTPEECMRAGGRYEQDGRWKRAYEEYKKAREAAMTSGDRKVLLDANEAMAEMKRHIEHGANDGLEPIPVDDQVLGKGAVGDRKSRVRDSDASAAHWKRLSYDTRATILGYLRRPASLASSEWGTLPVPVQEHVTRYFSTGKAGDTEWNDPKPRGSYKLTTSAALKTPSEVASVYGKKDPEGFKKTFGKDGKLRGAEAEERDIWNAASKAEREKWLYQTGISKELATKKYEQLAPGDRARLGEVVTREANDGLEPIPVDDQVLGKGAVGDRKSRVRDSDASAAHWKRLSYDTRATILGYLRRPASLASSEWGTLPVPVQEHVTRYFSTGKAGDGETYGGYPTRAEALREYKVETAKKAKDAQPPADCCYFVTT